MCGNLNCTHPAECKCEACVSHKHMDILLNVRKTAFYISHDDHVHFPTYELMDGVLLVEGPIDRHKGNPCSEANMVSKGYFPTTDEEGLRFFARAFGFSVEVDNDGQLVLCTGIYKH